MGLGLERLFLLAAPFFAVAAVSKRKKANKPPKKKLKSIRAAAVKRSKKPVPRVAGPARKQPPVAKKGAARGRVPMPVKPPQKPVVKPVPAEIPEPVPVAPVGRPILLSPEHGKYADSINPRFRWLSVGGATRYEVNWGLDPNHANSYVVVSVSTEAVVPVEKPLTIGVTYYWRVRGGNEAGWGPWSTTGSFGVLEETD